MATGDVITHDQLIEDGAFDPAQEGAKALNDIIGTLEDSFISFGTAAKEAIKWANPDNLTVEGYKKLTDQLDTMNTVTEQSVKTDKLKAQSLKALADQEKANTIILKQKAAQEKANTDAQAKSIVLTKEQIAQKQLDAAKDREAIALIKAKMAASNEALGTTQRIAAANAVLRNEQKNLNLTTAEGIARNGEINKQLDLNNGTIKKNADALKQQAMNVGNYSKSFTHSLRPIEELVRGIGYAMGVPIEGLREYTGVIRGATELNHKHSESIKGVTGATEEQTAAEAIQLDESGNVIAAKEADAAANMEVAETEYAVLGPLALIIAGVAAVISIYEIWSESNKKAVFELNEQSYAMDGTIITDKKLRDSYNESIITIGKLKDQYAILTNKMTDSEAAMDEMALKNRKMLTDLQNETTSKLQEVSGTWHSLWNGIKDIFTGETPGEHSAEEMGKILAAQKEQNAEIADEQAQEELNNIAETDKAKAEAELSLRKSVLETQQAIEESKNNSERNDEIREQTGYNIYKKYTLAKLQADLEFEKKKPQTVVQVDKQRELMNQMYVVNKEYLDKTSKLEDESRRKHQAQMLSEISEAAKLSENKRNVALADYNVKSNAIADNANLTPAEKTQEFGNAARELNMQLDQIDRDHELQEQDLLKERTALILDTYTKEVETAKNAYAIELSNFKYMLEHQQISQTEYDQHAIDAKKALDEALFQADLKDKEKREVAGLKHQENMANSAVTEDSLKNTSINQSYKDKTAANTASENSALQKSQNDATAAYHRIVNAGTDAERNKAKKDLQEAFDEQADIKNQFHDKQTALDNAYFNEQLDRAQKAEEALTNALAEGLAKRSEMQQASDQENIDIHSRLMGVQATLAAQGRANSLASETADMERAEEQKKQDAIRAARQQEAIALSQSFLNLLVALTKKGDNNAAVEAMAETMAAKGLAAVIAGSALEGVEDTGTLGSGGLDGKGGRPWMLHDNERVLTKEQNAALGDISNDDLVNSFNNIYNHQFQSANSISGKNATFTSEITSQLIPKLDMVVRAIESQPRQSVSLGKIGEWHETVVKDSQKIIIHHLRNGGRSKL